MAAHPGVDLGVQAAGAARLRQQRERDEDDHCGDERENQQSLSSAATAL